MNSDALLTGGTSTAGDDADVGDNDEKKLMQAFNVYWCESQKWLMTIQCAYYAIWFVANVVTSVQLDVVINGFPAAFWYSLGLTFPGTNLTSNATQNPHGVSNFIDELVVETAMYAVVKLLNALLLVLAVVLIRRKKYQLNWNTYSTIILVMGAIVSPVPLEAWSSATQVKNILQARLNLTTPTQGDLRALSVEFLLLGSTWRYTGTTGLQLLSFAPRFWPYCSVCCAVMAFELILELVIMYDVIVTIAGDSESWQFYLSHYGFPTFGQIIYCNISTYAVPVAVVWLFERMLWSTSPVVI